MRQMELLPGVLITVPHFLLVENDLEVWEGNRAEPMQEANQGGKARTVRVLSERL